MNLSDYTIALKALADDTRLFIFKSLLKEELCGCKLLEMVNCNQSTLSHHMKILVNCGLVIGRKDWKWTYYSVNKDNLDSLIAFLKQE